MKTWYKAIAFILLFAFLFYDISWTQGGTPIWHQAKPVIKINGRVILNGIKIPYDAGTPQEAFSTSGDEVVINIQDAHASLTAQYSIVKILENLASNYDLELIALEGAEGPVDISLLKTFPDPEIRKDIADYFIREGKMSAGEFFSIVSEKPIKLYGIENSQLYQANIDALNKLMEKKVVCLENIQGLLNTLKAIEPKVYSKDLLKLNKNSILHQEGNLAFTKHWDFVEKLAKRNNIEIVIFENLSKLLKSIELEKDIDFVKANEERKLLIDELSKVLPKRELEKLVLESLSFKKGKISQTEFQQYLIRLAQDIKLDPKPCSNLIKFTRYITIYEDIDLLVLFQEVEQFEDYIREKIFRNDEERTLYNLTKAVRTIDGLFKISLNNNDYDFIKAKKRYFDRTLISDFIKKNYAKHNLIFEHEYDLGIIFDNTEEAVEFYNIAQRRNKVMIANTIRVMKKHAEQFAALITGGFHSKGLASVMKEEGLSYLVVMPKFKEGEQRPYLAVLTNKRQPYEKLLDTEEYILSAPALCWTDTPEEILRGLFGAYGLAYLKGKPIELLVLEHREAFRKYLEVMEGLRRGEAHYKRPITLEQFDETFGVQVDEKGKAVGIEEGEGIVIRVARVDGKEVIVIRDYKEGRIEYQVALTRNEEGRLTLHEVVPEEAILKLREEEKTKAIGRRVTAELQKPTVERVKQLFGAEIGKLTPEQRKDREEILEAVITRMHYRAQQRGVSPAELKQQEKLSLFIRTLRSKKGYLISPKWLEQDEEFKGIVLSALGELPLLSVPALTPIASERLAELSIYNLRAEERVREHIAQEPLPLVVGHRIEEAKKGLIRATVYSLRELKTTAEMHRRRAKQFDLDIEAKLSEEELRVIKEAPRDWLEKMRIDDVVKAERLDLSEREAPPLNIKEAYERYRAEGYAPENILIIDKYRGLSEEEEAFLTAQEEEEKVVVVQYRDRITERVFDLALRLWARRFDVPDIPGVEIIKKGLLLYILPPMEKVDLDKLEREINRYREILMAV
ncbi:MAG: hypothetical protein WBC74_04020 [Candidatus Omnitrophota bacterium]